MGKRSGSVILVLLFAGAMVVNPYTFAQKKLSSRIARLIDESKSKRCNDDSGILNSNPLMPEDILQAIEYVKSNPTYVSYHLLLAIRTYFPASYKQISKSNKAAILCSALANTNSLNDWGYLDPRGSVELDAANALLETGKESLKFLGPILDDDARAPLFGSKEHTASSLYKYRRMDFAYRYASLICGERPVFYDDPRDRDKDIRALKAKLKSDSK